MLLHYKIARMLGPDLSRKNRLENLELISHVNQLSEKWANELLDGQAVVGSGLGIWLLLATLLSGAEGEARNELESATGLKQSEAATAVAAVLNSIDGVDGLGTAVAIWVRDTIELLPEFVAKFPQIEIAALPDRQELFDEWASRATDGLIAKFPLKTSSEALMVLASALVAKGKWKQPFSESDGFLSVAETDLSKAAFVQNGKTTISRIVVAAENGMDVHLVAGHRTDLPSDVISAGLSELMGTCIVTPGDQLQDGQEAGCLKATLVYSPTSELYVSLPQFQIDSSHDLLEHGDVLGLKSACDASRGHFPGISNTPLAIEGAAQSATIEFGPKGFEAAAVTVVGVFGGRGPDCDQVRSLNLLAHFRWPFGFIVVHRDTQLALFHGWVDESACKVDARRLRFNKVC